MIPFSHAVNANQLHRCDAPRCSLPRTSISLHCAKHAQQARRYGHPHGTALSPKLWDLQRKQIAELLARNITHRGQLQAIEFLQGLLDRANHNEGAFFGAEELSRLARHGVTPTVILQELCAVSLYLHDASRAVLNDRAADFAIARAVFSLAPRPRRHCRPAGSGWGVSKPSKPAYSYSPKVRHSALLFMGTHLRQSLAPFLANIRNAVSTKEEQQRAFEAALNAPLAVL